MIRTRFGESNIRKTELNIKNKKPRDMGAFLSRPRESLAKSFGGRLQFQEEEVNTIFDIFCQMKHYLLQF